MKRLLGFVLFCLLVSLLAATTAIGQESTPLQVRINEMEYRFGEHLAFHLEAVSAVELVSGTLAYKRSESSGLTVETLSFDPTTSISITVEVDLSQRVFYPFIPVTYWWTFYSTDGSLIQTPPQTAVYVDDRFEWKSLEGRRVTVRWYGDRLELAQQTIDAAERTLDQLERQFGTITGDPIQIYLYDSVESFQTAIPPQRQLEWLGGLAYPHSRTILFCVLPGDGEVAALRRLLPHELTHLIVHEFTAYSTTLPKLLDEGLAVLAEEVPVPEYAVALQDAFQTGSTLPLASLCPSWPDEAGEARLAYAQSADVVRYLREQWGFDGVIRLLQAYTAGAQCDEGVRQALDLSLGELEARWIADRTGVAPSDTPSPGALTGVASWLLLIGLCLVPVVSLSVSHPKTLERER